jgi:predicted LPLAT superfamily acyltransferase
MAAETEGSGIGRKRGNAFSLWFFKTAVRLFGLRGAYGLLYPVCLHYALFDRAAVASAMPYVRRRFPQASRPWRWFKVWMLFVSQGKQLIDRYAFLGGHIKFDFSYRDPEFVRKTVASADSGLVLVTSHAGNWQIALAELGELNRDVYLLMLPEENEAMRRTLALRDETATLRIISSEGHLGGVVEIMKALGEGAIVSIMGDRAEGFESIPVDFLGEKAAFPFGAFQIAACARVPVMFLFSHKTGTRSYDVDMTKVMHPVFRDRKRKREDLASWVQDYADMLGDYARAHPLQCFLFRDVWNAAPSPGTPHKR